MASKLYKLIFFRFDLIYEYAANTKFSTYSMPTDFEWIDNTCSH